MPDERLVRLSMELHQLGISNRGIMELLAYAPERVEAQLRYLPYRKARRKEAFLMEAVRNNYSPPKEFFNASTQTQPIHPGEELDQGAKCGP